MSDGRISLRFLERVLKEHGWVVRFDRDTGLWEVRRHLTTETIATGESLTEAVTEALEESNA